MFGHRENPGKMATPSWLVKSGDQSRNLAELAVARMVPQALLFDCDDGRRFTFGQFWDLAGKFANALHLSGAKSGDRIAVQISKSVEAIALFWACARGGFVYLPMNTAYTAAEVRYFIEDAKPSVFVCRPEFAKLGFEIACILTVDDRGGGNLAEIADQQPRDFSDHASSWNDTVAILYTSGTTGRSKGAMLSHGNLASNALALIDVWGFGPADRLIHALPVYHTHGLFTATNVVMLSGGRMLFRRSFDAGDVLSLMSLATTMMGVPTFYTRLLQSEQLSREATAGMRLFISGSAPLLAETHVEFERRTGHIILERYGMTETSMITSNPLAGERKAGSVGLPLPSVDVRITDLGNHAPVARGAIGMIELKGPNLFKGYWQNPEKTAEDMTVEGYFRTGDVGSIDKDGYLTISGRAKDLIISGGFNVYPKEIELLIDMVPGVAESAVIGLPHGDFGEAVTAVVVRVFGGSVAADDILGALQAQLAKFKLPKQIVFEESLPRNAMGKVQKAALRERYKRLYLPV